MNHNMSEAEALAHYSTCGLKRNELTRSEKKQHLKTMCWAPPTGGKKFSPEQVEEIVNELYGPEPVRGGMKEVRIALFDDEVLEGRLLWL